jgi:hypothetical protein
MVEIQKRTIFFLGERYGGENVVPIGERRLCGTHARGESLLMSVNSGQDSIPPAGG